MLATDSYQGIQHSEGPPDLDIKGVVLAIWGMYYGMHRWYRQEGRLSIDAIMPLFTRLTLDGVRGQARD